MPNSDRAAFFTHLLQTIPATLEKVTCHCCKKSLARCYRDILDPAAPRRCPFA